MTCLHPFAHPLSSASAKDISSKIDEFYLKVFLGPEDDGKRRESVKRKKSQKNREGHFERQDFKFPITYDELLDKRLMVQFFDCGRIGRFVFNHFLLFGLIRSTCRSHAEPGRRSVDRLEQPRSVGRFGRLGRCGKQIGGKLFLRTRRLQRNDE